MNMRKYYAICEMLKAQQSQGKTRHQSFKSIADYFDVTIRRVKEIHAKGEELEGPHTDSR